MKRDDTVILETSLPGLTLFKKGKVRDVYELNGNLLFIATDRVSVFDVVIPTGIPYKGRVLTALSEFWFNKLAHITPSHFITSDIKEMGRGLELFGDVLGRTVSDVLEGRSMLVEKTQPLPVECVVRGYLAGSGLKEYRETGRIQDIELPAGLRESEKLSEPIFTPATKAETGHDENIPVSRMEDIVGIDVTREAIDKSMEIFVAGSEYALERGIILADAKFEWGFLNDRLILIDEVFTPDSSRFWPLEGYSPGRPQPSFDKQYVRDFLESTDWDKTPPAPPLPDEIVKKTTEKYLEAYTRLTGKSMS
ncbi:MAG: phosphoribosylaminoimidazolesuccinocarboxamide synthase [Candidatus Brocadiales bacterium]|nr:phosphoribosylaminoimidazolesuccinocarboxamide synthase [Candidatus Bathyanammoxibius amoris]